jgi:glycosyltransferase involved in cell wall biosynthesis
MKIGIIHHQYSLKVPSGENLTVAQMGIDLKKEFDEVSFWTGTITSKLFGRESLFVFLFRHLIFDFENHDFEKWLFKNDAVQIHNNFPLLTRKNLESLRRYGEEKPIFRVIHNYRSTCLKGTQFRRNKKCNLCSVKTFTPGILRSCYKKNPFLSMLVASNTRLLRKVIINSTRSLFVGVSPNITKYLIEIVETSKVITISNRIPEPERVVSQKADEVLYLGRLDPEKDVITFLNNWTYLLKNGARLPKLNIVGTGTQQKAAEKLCSQFPDNIFLHGFLTGNNLEVVFERCKIFIFTSKWAEPFGRTMVEAAARGMYLIGPENPVMQILVKKDVNGSILADDYSNLLKCVNSGMSADYASHTFESQKRFRDNFKIGDTNSEWTKLYQSILG